MMLTAAGRSAVSIYRENPVEARIRRPRCTNRFHAAARSSLARFVAMSRSFVADRFLECIDRAKSFDGI